MNSDVELVPAKAVFSPGDQVRIEVRGAEGGELIVRHLGDVVVRVPSGGRWVDLGPLPEGGYSVEWRDDGGSARTAVQVLADPRSRLRYGFVVDYAPRRDIDAVVDNIRRLHLNAVQFYDWAYRHAELLGGGEEYADALGQPVSLETVRRLAADLRAAGAEALGYAAVYAVGDEQWQRWRHDALLTAEGAPYALADFLRIVDPAAPDWLEHLKGQLVAATDSVGFAGFHLDQYGFPKRAGRADGVVVDLAASFVALLESVRESLPGSRLVFNNVNDFPTWATARTSQDAVYVEVWDPHETLGALSRVATRARAVAGGKPVVVAAYQHVYDDAPAHRADLATALTMAALYSHGATQLLAGEADRILVDPYYVRNHVAEESTREMLARWYDFAVMHDELLFDPAIVDVTGSYAGAYNGDLDVELGGHRVSGEADAGAVWRTVRSTPHGLVVHLVNLLDQTDARWDAPREPIARRPHGRLRLRATRGATARIMVADPDGTGHLVAVPHVRQGEYIVAELPPLDVWQLILVTERGGS